MKKLEWSDTPEKVHIAGAYLDLYDSLAKAGPEGAMSPVPDPELLRAFLWSNDYGICERTFIWCLDLGSISQSGTPENAHSTRIFIPATMGYQWIEHFVHVLCKGEYWRRAISWEFLVSRLVPRWAMISSSWCHDFASALLFTIVQPPDTHGNPAYQCLAEAHKYMSLDERQALLPFLSTLLELAKSSLTWGSIISAESWLTQLPESLENQDAHAHMEDILTSRKQQLQEENLAFLEELPMAGEWPQETLELFAELPMADEWMEEILGFFAELPMASGWMDE